MADRAMTYPFSFGAIHVQLGLEGDLFTIEQIGPALDEQFKWLLATVGDSVPEIIELVNRSSGGAGVLEVEIDSQHTISPVTLDLTITVELTHKVPEKPLRAIIVGNCVGELSGHFASLVSQRLLEGSLDDSFRGVVTAAA